MQVLDYQEAIFASNLSSNAKLTALVIGSYYNWQKKQECWPSNESLAKATGLSISTLTRAKKELISEGYLLSHRRYDSTNTYIPVLPQSIASAQTEHSLCSQRATNNEVNNEVNNVIKVDSFQSSTFSNTNKNTSRKEIENERTKFRPRPTSQRDTTEFGQSNKGNGSRAITDAELARFAKELAEASADQW